MSSSCLHTLLDCEGMNWTYLAEDEVQLRNLVATIINLREFMHVEEFLG